MKRRFTFLAVTAVTLMAIICGALMAPSPVVAGGVTQISGIAFNPNTGECTDSQGQNADVVIKLTGDLKGCLYSFIQTATCSPSGVYRETGTEIFVEEGNGSDTFGTTYHFEAKFQDCNNLAGEIVGRCEHPIVTGSGTGFYQGVTGRLDFKDDVVAGNFPYRGHLGW
jgi:hypothetical protein